MVEWKEFIKPTGPQTYLGGGKIETLITAPTKKLVKEYKRYGDHTEISNWRRWKPCLE